MPTRRPVPTAFLRRRAASLTSGASWERYCVLSTPHLEKGQREKLIRVRPPATLAVEEFADSTGIEKLRWCCEQNVFEHTAPFAAEPAIERHGETLLPQDVEVPWEELRRQSPQKDLASGRSRTQRIG